MTLKNKFNEKTFYIHVFYIINPINLIIVVNFSNNMFFISMFLKISYFLIDYLTSLSIFFYLAKFIIFPDITELGRIV